VRTGGGYEDLLAAVSKLPWCGNAGLLRSNSAATDLRASSAASLVDDDGSDALISHLAEQAADAVLVSAGW